MNSVDCPKHSRPFVGVSCLTRTQNQLPCQTVCILCKQLVIRILRHSKPDADPGTNCWTFEVSFALRLPLSVCIRWRSLPRQKPIPWSNRFASAPRYSCFCVPKSARARLFGNKKRSINIQKVRDSACDNSRWYYGPPRP